MSFILGGRSHPFFRATLTPFRAADQAICRILPNREWANRAISKYRYFLDNGRLPDVLQGVSFPERLMARKFSPEASDPLYKRLTDKELVKEWIQKTIGPGHTVETLAILRLEDEIALHDFPPCCVIKPTHSTGDVILLPDRVPSPADRARMKRWLKKDLFLLSREPNYLGLERKVIVEPFLGEDGEVPEDIKVFCFHGQPRFLQVDRSRHTVPARDFYDMDGTWLNICFRYGATGRPFPYIERLKEIDMLSRALSSSFAFVRVDFYAVPDKLLIGELTFFPANAAVHFTPPAADQAIARMFDDPGAPL